MNLENIKLKNFIDLKDDEKLFVLSWRNDKKIRKWMYSSEVISTNNHLNFINSLKFKKDNIYFLVEQNDKQLGVIYFNKIDYEHKSCYFGIYAKPNSRGFGKILMSSIVNYAFFTLKVDRLIAEVFTKNDKAISLYKKFNFEQIDTKVVDNRDMIIMELKNENR